MSTTRRDFVTVGAAGLTALVGDSFCGQVAKLTKEFIFSEMNNAHT